MLFPLGSDLICPREGDIWIMRWIRGSSSKALARQKFAAQQGSERALRNAASTL